MLAVVLSVVFLSLSLPFSLYLSTQTLMSSPSTETNKEKEVTTKRNVNSKSSKGLLRVFRPSDQFA